MQIRDRIRELRRVPARQLRPHPRNWRLHPEGQQAALRGVLEEIGYADALLARELDDGSLELIDGHLRAETTPDQLVPVLVLDVSASEADRILLTHDPLAGMAEAHQEHLHKLLADCSFESPAVQGLLAELDADFDGNVQHDSRADGPAASAVRVPELFQVLVTCQSEEEQREVYESLTAQGRQVRVLTL